MEDTTMVRRYKPWFYFLSWKNNGDYYSYVVIDSPTRELIYLILLTMLEEGGII